MDKKNTHLNNYFDEVEKFSAKHLKDIDRFSKLLDSLRTHRNNPEFRNHISNIENTIKKLDTYVHNNNIKLSPSEQDDINKINESKSSPALKNRMLEDLFHKIKNNHKSESEKNKKNRNAEDEISRINKKEFFIKSWFDLFFFALSNSTITLLGHNIKDTSLSNIKENLLRALNETTPFLKALLDKEYYIFSITEYNSLEKILHLEEAIYNINKVPWNYYYNAVNLRKEMQEFCELYLTVLENSAVIDSNISKLSQNRQLPHGFYGNIRIILDSPIKNNRTIKYKGPQFYQNTIKGALISYYTSLNKRLITSLSQIKYLLNINTEINTNMKNLTSVAAKIEKEKRVKEEQETETTFEKYNDIKQIFERYIPIGKELSDILIEEDYSRSNEPWIRNYETSPMFKPIKLIEAFIKHFIDRINTPNSFIFRYYNSEFTHYFENHKDITNISKNLNTIDLELTGGNLKELLDIPTTETTDTETFIEKAKAAGLKGDLKASANLIQTAGSKFFTLAERCRNIINTYENNREINYQLPEENYSFFKNAELAARRQLKLNKIIGKEPLLLEDILTSVCSISYYLSYILQSDSIQELSRVKSEIESSPEFNKMNISNINTSDSSDHRETAPQVKQKEYIDPLTKLFKYDYFTEIIEKQEYNSREQFTAANRRFLFFLQIENFLQINKTMGHESGDNLLKRVSDILLKKLPNPGKNFLIRFKNAQIIGFIHTDEVKDVIDYLSECGKIINNISISANGRKINSTFIESGIIEEKKYSNIKYNMDLANRLMHSGHRNDCNTIAILKNNDIRIKRRNFNNDGSIDSNLLYIIS